MHTKKGVLGADGFVLELSEEVTSRFCTIYTKKDVLGEKDILLEEEFVLLLLQVVTSRF
jgi:hypothetical protein